MRDGYVPLSLSLYLCKTRAQKMFKPVSATPSPRDASVSLELGERGVVIVIDNSAWSNILKRERERETKREL